MFKMVATLALAVTFIIGVVSIKPVIRNGAVNAIIEMEMKTVRKSLGLYATPEMLECSRDGIWKIWDRSSCTVDELQEIHRAYSTGKIWELSADAQKCIKESNPSEKGFHLGAYCARKHLHQILNQALPQSLNEEPI